MFTAGFSLPEMAELNVLRSGLDAMAAEATWLPIPMNEPAPPGTCAL